MSGVQAFPDLPAARAFVLERAALLDPHSRYVAELLSALDASASVADLERRLLAGCRGQRHAGPEVFARMTLAEKLLANLITAETTLFRFTEGELEALDREILPRLRGRTARVLIVPCSHGEEAFTMASFLLKSGVDFEIHAFDLQPALIAEARTGELTFGFPREYLAQPGRVSAEVLSRIRFEVGDAFDLPLPAPLEGEGRRASHASARSEGLPVPHQFDVVLCRNFLGYFVPEKVLELTGKLAARVAPGGVLFLDSFCLLKFSAIQRELNARHAHRVGERPVFLFR